MPDPFSLFPQAPAPSHPLDPSAILGLADQVNKLQLFQKEFQARQGVGAAAAAARRPDGSLDPSMFASGLHANPATDFTALETAQKLADYQTTQSALSAKRQGDFISAIGSMPTNATMDDANHIAVLHAGGRNASAAEIMPALTELQRAWNADEEARRRKQPATNFADTVAKYRNMSIGPTGLSTVQEGPPSASGAPTPITTKELLERATPGTSTYGGGQGAPLTKGLGPAEKKSFDAMAANDAHESNFRAEMFPWEQAIESMKRLKELHPEGGFFAPGAKARNDFKAFVYGFSPTLARWGANPEDMKEFAKSDKYLTQATQQRANDFGVHSDQGLATAIRGQPNVSVNDLTGEELIPAAAAVRRAQYLQHMASKEGGGASYLNNSAKWGANRDIRALTFDILDDKQKAKLLSSLKKGTPEYERFNNTLREAYKYGVMDRPRRGNGP